MADFPIWDALQLPKLDHHGDGETFTVQRGMPYGTGPGIAITSYDPSRIITETPPGEMDRGGYQGWGVAHIATDVTLAYITNPPTRPPHQVTDAVLRCGDRLIPALAFNLLPGAQVVVSADLLTHAVAVVAWQIHLFRLRLERTTRPD